MIERTSLLTRVDMTEHIHQSNLVEDIDDPFEDRLSALAWKYISNCPRLTRDIILNLHRHITINQLPAKDAGRNRSVTVWVGSHECPPPYTALLMFNEWINDMRGWRNLDPQEMHIRFEKMHPFIDGNGRTGRMLMWWHQMKRGQMPLLIAHESRHLYYRWFQGEL